MTAPGGIEQFGESTPKTKAIGYEPSTDIEVPLNATSGKTSRAHSYHGASGTDEGERPETRSKDPVNQKAFALNETIMERRSSLRKSKEDLLRRKFAQPPAFTRDDERRLAYVLWQIDRIEHARMSDDLDALGRLADLHEQLAGKVEGFVNSVSEALSPAPRRKRRR